MSEADKARQEIFYGTLREYLVVFLIFVCLYAISFLVISYFTRTKDQEDYYSDDGDAMVYRISLWLCSFTLSVSLAALLLLPASILSNEIMLHYPSNYYMQWLNASLLRRLWNNVFVCSNTCLFLLMPFVYFFTEAEGFSGFKHGLRSRILETVVLLCLLAMLMACLAWIISSVMATDSSGRSLFYVPLIYSFLSLGGVLFTLLCMPVGVEYMLAWLGGRIVLPQNLNDTVHALQFEEDDIRRRLTGLAVGSPSYEKVSERLEAVQQDRLKREEQLMESSVWWLMFFSLCAVVIFILTFIVVASVALNFLHILVDSEALAIGAADVLGKSYNWLGTVGAGLEVAIVLYFAVASLVGFYSSALSRTLRPQKKNTAMTKLIANCIVMLVQSSALPVLVRILGITKFDLLGLFGSLDWLRNWYLVMAYIVIFEAITVFFLTRKVAMSVLKKLQALLHLHFISDSKQALLPEKISHTIVNHVKFE